MRNIINISLPASLKKDVEFAIKDGQYASRSEFFRALIRMWKEQKILNEVKLSRKEIQAGKGKVLRSLKDLV